jgi:hypothetical protein
MTDGRELLAPRQGLVLGDGVAWWSGGDELGRVVALMPSGRSRNRK